jgi:hypothetical protein
LSIGGPKWEQHVSHVVEIKEEYFHRDGDTNVGQFSASLAPFDLEELKPRALHVSSAYNRHAMDSGWKLAFDPISTYQPVYIYGLVFANSSYREWSLKIDTELSNSSSRMSEGYYISLGSSSNATNTHLYYLHLSFSS